MSSRDTARRFFRSAGAAAFSQFWRVGVAFLAELLLRRLVPDEDWGLYEWVLPVFLVLGAVRDLGLAYHVARVQPRPYGNLLALELAWGGPLALATTLGAPLLARGFSGAHPELLPVIQAFAIFLFFEGLSSVPRVYFEYELEIGRLVFPEIVRNLVFVLTSLGLAYSGYGVWSLAAAQIAAAVVYALHLWWRARGRIPLHFARGRTGALVAASLPLALIWFLLILIENVDPLIVAARFDADVVGNYKFAYKYAFIAKLILMPAIARALYPALVAFAAEPRQLFQTFRLATLALFAFEAPLAWFLFANRELVLRLLGGTEQWLLAPSFLLILCFAPLIDPFSRLGGEVLKALHQDRLWIVSSSLTLASFIVAGILLTGSIGPHGMAWANFLPIGGAVMAWALHRLAPGPFRAFVKELAVLYLAPVVPFLALRFLIADRPVLRLALSVAAMALVALFYYRRFGHSFIAFLKDPVAAAGEG